MSVLYRGTCIYDDEPISGRRSRVEPKPGVRVYRKVKAGKRNDREWLKLYYAGWRAKHRERLRVYNREYQRVYRKKKLIAAGYGI